MDNIQKATQRIVDKILEKRKPLGNFYIENEQGGITGIDNSDGHAWFEDFDNLEDCKRWLKGESLDSIFNKTTKEDNMEDINNNIKINVDRIKQILQNNNIETSNNNINKIIKTIESSLNEQLDDEVKHLINELF
jgi:hypothetical protein